MLVQTTMQGSDLKRILVTLNKCANAKSPRPILAGIRVDGEGFHATDLESAVSFRQSGFVDGEIIVDGRGLARACKGFTAKSVVSARIVDGALELESQAGTVRVPSSADCAEWPVIVGLDEPNDGIEFVSSELREGLERVSVCSATDSTRFQMHSVQFELGSESTVLVATDGKRLAHRRLESARTHNFDVPVTRDDFLVDLRAVQLLMRILPKGGVARLEFDSFGIQYVGPDWTFRARFIDGKFPDWKRAVPDSHPMSWVLDVQHTLDVLRHVSSVTTKETKSTRWTFGSALEISARGDGESSAVVPIHDGCGLDFVIDLNPEYVIAYLRKARNPLFRLEAKDARTCVGFSDDGLNQITMPLVTEDTPR